MQPVVFLLKMTGRAMKSCTRISLCFLAGTALCTFGCPVAAEAADHPYRFIATTNVFRLKSPPESKPEETPPPPPPIITLQGITTTPGYPVVLCKVIAPTQMSQPAKEVSYVLGEGEREGEIEVLRINALAGTVTFRNHGIGQVLSLRK